MDYTQWRRLQSDVLDSSTTLHSPDQDLSFDLMEFLNNPDSDTGTEVQVAADHSQDIDSTTLPCMCHAGCSQSTAHETLTQSHGPHHQYHSWGSAVESSKSSPHIKPPWLNQYWTNLPNVLSEQSQSTSTPPQATFVPTGNQDLNMSSHFIGTMSTEDRDVPGGGLPTPQLSYVSTPESFFIRSNQLQNFRDGSQGITTPAATGDGRGAERNITKPMLMPQPTSKLEVDNRVKREFGTPVVRDWLSEPSFVQDWNDNFNIQVAHNHQQPIFISQQSLSPLVATSRQLADNGAITVSPNHFYTHHGNGMHQQILAGEAFQSPLTPYDPSGQSYVENSPFSPSPVRGNYLTHSYPVQEGFDFNATPMYPTIHYPAGYAQYGLIEHHDTLPTQHGTLQLPGHRSSRSRAAGKAVDLDEKLLKWRSEGMTYREIMKKGDWGLEESTLRGRYRTLTKSKQDRVRKPVWDHASLSALVAGVDRLAPPVVNSPRTIEGLDKIPWKKVAEWMQRDKGCYLYGNATAKKKYKELVGDHQMQWEVNQWRRVNGEHPF